MMKEWETDADVIVLPGAHIVGKDIEIGEGTSVWYNVVIRSEEYIKIGKDNNIQDNCVFHAGEGNPIEVGDGCTIGHSAIIHGCKIGNNTLIGMGAIVMDDAVIGDNCIIGAHALVTHRTIIPDNSMVLGSPAKIVRQLTDKEVAVNRHECKHYMRIKEWYR